MADIQRTVEIIFGAIDNTGSGVSSVANNLNSFTDSASNITAPLSDVAVFAGKAEAAVLSLAVAYGTYAAIKASEFQTAQIDLNKVLDETDPKIETFTGTVFKLSETYGQSSASILQGIANFKQAGFTATESAELQKNALDLIIAGDVDAAAASQTLISAIKGMSAEASDAPRFIEALNNVSNKYATDVPQLADGISRLAPILKVMGFSFEEGTALLTPLIEVFGSGSEAADALKTGLLKLTDNSKPVIETLRALGVSQLDLNGNMRSGKDIFYDVAAAFKTLDDNQKLVYTQQLVGIEQAPKMVLAFDNIAKINEITAVAMEHTGSVAQEVNLRLASTKIQTDILKESFDNLAIVIGEKINTQFGGVVSGSSSILQAFRGIVESGGLDKFFEALKPQMEAFASTLQNIAKNLPEAFKQVDFSGLISALKDLGLEFGNVFDGLDLNTTKGLTQAIQFVVDSFESLTRVVTGVIDAWEPLVKTFLAGVEQFNNLDDASKRTFGSVSGIANVFETLKSTLTGGFDALNTIGASLTVIAGSNVVSGITALGPALAGITASALPLATALTAITIGVGGVAFGITENINAWQDYKARQDAVADSTAHLTETQGNIKDKLAEISQSTGIAVGSMDELNKAVDAGTLVFNEATGAYEAAGSGVRDYDAEVAAASKGGFSFADAVNEVAANLGLAGKAADDTAGTFSTLADAEAAAVLEMDKGKNTSITFADGIYTLHSVQQKAAESSDSLAKSTKDAAKAAETGSTEWKNVQEVMLQSQKQADDFSISLGELSNKRYEINVKAVVDLRVAEIQADTARIQAAFQATSETIATLSKGVTDLWSVFAGDNVTGLKKLAIEDAAQRMEDRLDKELELKAELTQAIIDKARAQTERIQSGDALIRVDSGDLAPELDSLFEKILQRVQIKATEEGFNLLLGLGAD